MPRFPGPFACPPRGGPAPHRMCDSRRQVNTGVTRWSAGRQELTREYRIRSGYYRAELYARDESDRAQGVAFQIQVVQLTH